MEKGNAICMGVDYSSEPSRTAAYIHVPQVYNCVPAENPMSPNYKSFANRKREAGGKCLRDGLGWYKESQYGRWYAVCGNDALPDHPTNWPGLKGDYLDFQLKAYQETHPFIPPMASVKTDPKLLDAMRQSVVQELIYSIPAPQKPADAPYPAPARCAPIFGESSLSDLRKGVLACWDSFRPAGF